MADKLGRRLYLAAACMMIFMGLVHSLSFLRKPSPTNETERQMLDLMTTYHMNVAGSDRTMQNFLTGFSVAFMLAALGFGALDLALSRERSSLLKRVALFNVLWLIAMLANSLHYFFIVPTTFLSVTLLLFILAWLKLPADSPA
jgi:hypothetical protein